MAVEIRINGDLILNVKALSVRSSLTTLSNSFSLLTSPGENATTAKSNLNFSAGQKAEIKINNTLVINGFVDAVRVSYTKDAHEIEIAGRDRTADFIDSSVPQINVEEAIEFEKLLRTTLDAMSLQDIEIVNLIPVKADLLIRKDKNIVAEVGQTGFDFIEQFARLKQVLLRGDGAGNIQMTRGGGDRYIRVALINIPGFAGNNIISGEFVQSHAQRFNNYTVKAQEDFSSPDFEADVAAVIGNTGTAIDTDVRSGRNLVFEAEENSTSAECIKRAAWESDLRRAKGTKLAYIILGHTATYTEPEDVEGFGFGKTTVLWEPNSLVNVADVFANVQAVMLIESVRYEISPPGGNTTELVLVPKDSYTIQASRDAVEARNSLIGNQDE